MADTSLAEKTSTAAANRRSRAKFNQAMKWVRRSHLYAGLFMTPWVFLYGVTALLFNHADVFPDFVARTIHADAFAGTSLEHVPRPALLAGKVVDLLNATGDAETPATPYRLVDPEEASYSREMVATAKGKGKSYTVRYDLTAKAGSIREVVDRPPTPPVPFASRRPRDGDKPPLQALKTELAKSFEGMQIGSQDLLVRTSPELNFLMQQGDKAYRVQYDLGTGAISGREESAAGEPITTRRFLLRLHTAHGYPNVLGTRWFWAACVDIMFVCMVGWGITGLLMWWQMKNVRKIGIYTLAASAVAATLLTIGMHGNMTTPSPGGGRGGPPEPAVETPAKGARSTRETPGATPGVPGRERRGGEARGAESGRANSQPE